MPSWVGLLHGVPPITNEQLAIARQAIQISGPRIDVQIGVPNATAKALADDGKPLPPPIIGKGLIDTGASNTSIDEAIVAQLGLPIVNRVNVSTPTTTEMRNVHAVRMAFPGTALPAIEQPMMAMTLQNQGIIALLGRDFLDGKTLHYDGVLAIVTLTF